MKDKAKKNAAEKAAQLIKPGMAVGLGSGSTVNHLIDYLGKNKPNAVFVAASEESMKRAENAGLNVKKLNDLLSPQRPMIPLYIDGADEVDPTYNLIKGGGGALTREKIIASASQEFICIVDESKIVKKLGKFPLAVEVIPYASRYVELELCEISKEVCLREKHQTDNGNLIFDVKGLDYSDPLQLETELNNIPGVVENGVFSLRMPDRVIVGTDEGADYM
ncbi:MAG: ribose-5-phosphate isomerase RpiA [Candidatus Altiarchaeales archaeon]|nr:ribose-5-phosphate isomerase RpiA [Candidatus Altiarchaeales archaeon]